jgi:hypothetical protein
MAMTITPHNLRLLPDKGMLTARKIGDVHQLILTFVHVMVFFINII